MLLDADQIEQLTQRKRADAQRRELEHLRIPFRVRRDGSLVVLAADLSPQQAATIPAPADFEIVA